MIIQLPRKPFYGETYLVCLASPVDRTTFLQRAKVKPGSYAAELVADLHEQILDRSLELKRDYAEYFSREYSTFHEYLRKHVRLPPTLAQKVSDQCAAYTHILRFHSAYCFLEEAAGLELLQNLLEPGVTK